MVIEVLYHIDYIYYRCTRVHDGVTVTLGLLYEHVIPDNRKYNLESFMNNPYDLNEPFRAT
jgi:hypothetical protein